MLKRLEKKTLKAGDVVMFTDFDCQYAKWFAGKIGHVQSLNPDKTYCSVEWLEPVQYHQTFTEVSSFEITKFDAFHENF